MKLNAIVILWICLPFINYETTPDISNMETPQNQVGYLCDCGWRESRKWDDTNVMIKQLN